MSKTIFIAGSGGIGEAAALLLREWTEFEIAIYLGDVSEANLTKAKEFVLADSSKTTPLETVLMPFDGISDGMKAAFEHCDVLLDCSPGGQAPRMAQYAKDFKMHYANLTEYVAETDQIIDLAKDADTGFILQTGLAPGFVNVLAMSLYREFVEKFENEKIEKVGMKVGALTANAQAPHFYGFTWSPIGVATEYVKDSRVIRDYQITSAAALSARESIVIDGLRYEADLTSGGAADLPEFFEGNAKELDYKTLRHIGHYDWVQSIAGKLGGNEDVPKTLENLMLEAIPSVEDDMVLIHTSVDGFDSTGRRRLLEKAYNVKPLEINGKSLRAIQTTTAAPLCESAMMLLSGKYNGILLQSKVPPAEFLNGNFVRRVYG